MIDWKTASDHDHVIGKYRYVGWYKRYLQALLVFQENFRSPVVELFLNCYIKIEDGLRASKVIFFYISFLFVQHENFAVGNRLHITDPELCNRSNGMRELSITGFGIQGYAMLNERVIEIANPYRLYPVMFLFCGPGKPGPDFYTGMPLGVE